MIPIAIGTAHPRISSHLAFVLLYINKGNCFGIYLDATLK